MGFLSRAYRNLERRASLENPSVSLTDPDAWNELFGEHDSSSGVKVTRKRALGYPPLWRGINLIANGVAKLDLLTYRRLEGQDRERAIDHSAYPLLRRKPNRFLTAGKFKRTMQFHSLYFGNGYAAIFRRMNDRPESLLLLDPCQTFPFQADGELWYRTKIRGETRRIHADDVLHIAGLSFDGMVGLSVIELMADSIGHGLAAREYAAKFFKQGTTVNGILMIPGHLKGDAQERVMKYWKKIAGGLKESHKVALLQDQAKFQTITGLSPEQTQMLQTREFEAKEMANILGLPPHKLGDSSRVSYNSLEMENQAYLDDSLDPWLRGWEEESGDKLLSEEEKLTDSHFMEFNRQALVRADLNGRYRAYQTGRLGGWLSVNDIRKSENLPAIEGGDVYLQPLNMKTVGAGDNGEPGDNEPARALYRDAIFDRLQRLTQIEAKEARKSAERGGKFVSVIDGWFGQHEQRVVESIEPILRLWFHASGRDAARVDPVVDEFARDWCLRRKEDLLSASGVKADELARSVERTVSAWNDESVYQAVDELMGRA